MFFIVWLALTYFAKCLNFVIQLKRLMQFLCMNISGLNPSSRSKAYKNLKLQISRVEWHETKHADSVKKY